MRVGAKTKTEKVGGRGEEEGERRGEGENILSLPVPLTFDLPETSAIRFCDSGVAFSNSF